MLVSTKHKPQLRLFETRKQSGLHNESYQCRVTLQQIQKQMEGGKSIFFLKTSILLSISINTLPLSNNLPKLKPRCPCPYLTTTLTLIIKFLLPLADVIS